MQKQNTKFAYFGTPNFAVDVIETMKSQSVFPTVVVTAPDKPQGRKQAITPPPVKVWAEKNNIPVLQPEKLSDPEFIDSLKQYDCNLFVVASYGKIIPKEILDIPKHGTLNIHPSLLPKLRGASPIESAILKEDETGVTIMLIDEQMDHGPIVAQEKVNIDNWPPRKDELEKTLAIKGAEMLVDVIPQWVAGELEAKEQDHTKATFTSKITKADGEINLSDEPEYNFRKFQAYYGWPGVHFFDENNKRILIKDAQLENSQFVIKRVVPEGGKEVDWGIFKSNQ